MRKQREGLQKEWCGGRLVVSVFRKGKREGVSHSSNTFRKKKKIHLI